MKLTTTLLTIVLLLGMGSCKSSNTLGTEDATEKNRTISKSKEDLGSDLDDMYRFIEMTDEQIAEFDVEIKKYTTRVSLGYSSGKGDKSAAKLNRKLKRILTPEQRKSLKVWKKKSK